MAAVLPPPNRPPFAGGAIVPGRTPVDVRGADSEFGGRRVPTPLAGVAPNIGTPQYARAAGPARP